MVFLASNEAIIKRPVVSLRRLMVMDGGSMGVDSMDVIWKVMGSSSTPASDTVSAVLKWNVYPVTRRRSASFSDLGLIWVT